LPTPENFRSLAAMLCDAGPSPEEEVTAVPAAETADPQAVVDACREARLFAARVREAVGEAVAVVLEDIAADVLARELQMAPVDLSAVVERAIDRCLCEEPIRVRIHPEETRAIRCGIPVIADETLRRGDAMLELRSGTMDCTLGVRLSAVLQSAAC
jgi:flagellar assembly protein FliH